MRKFESKIFEEISLEEMHSKAIKVLETDRIKLDDFADLYDKEKIEADKKYVNEMQKKFKQDARPDQIEAQKLATIFEAVVHEHLELSDWLGSNITTIKTSQYDDIKNGVDTIVEFKEEEHPSSHLALAIDETFSSDIKKKFDKIKEGIEKGKLSEIKYFKPEHSGFRGELKKIPRVIVGADAKTVKTLGELWINQDNKALASHHIQFQILQEMLIQFESFKNYAQKINKPEIMAIYDNIGKIVKKIYEEKTRSLADDKDYETDSVFNAIKENSKYF